MTAKHRDDENKNVILLSLKTDSIKKATEENKQLFTP
jgi:hypothetical protein